MKAHHPVQTTKISKKTLEIGENTDLNIPF